MTDFTFDTTPVSGLGDAQPRNSRSTSSRTGRKTFKTDKEKSAIWPAQLESVLIEALIRYTPPLARGTRGRLQRFPKRNKLIAKHIFDVTGKSRSSKQVGSRIQQLRATCRDPELMSYLVDLTRFEGHSDRSSARSASVSDSRSQSEEAASPANNFDSIPLPAESPDAPLSPCSTIVQPTISKSICIELTVFDEDWRHHSRTAPNLFIDLEDPATAHNAVTDYPCTVNQAELHLAPVTTIRSFDLDKAALYRVTSTVYCTETAVYSHSFESVTSHDCRLTSSLVPAFWSQIIGSMSHTHAFTVLQTIDPIDSVASARIDLHYSIRRQYQSACISPVSSPGSSDSTYDSMPGFTDFTPYNEVVSSPVESGEYINAQSPHASFSAMPSTSSYGVPSTEPYPGESWSYSEPLQLHLQLSYHNHYTL